MIGKDGKPETTGNSPLCLSSQATCAGLMTSLNFQGRWYRPTPAHLLVVLLVLDGVLLLSERSRWFAFNEKKGLTVLIAVAAVPLAMLLILLSFACSMLFGWRFQFGTRTLIVLVTAVSIPCSWLATERRRAIAQRDAKAAIVLCGGTAEYDFQFVRGVWPPPRAPAEPVWLRSLLGDDFFADVVYVSLSSLHVSESTTDARLEHLKGLPSLQTLDLNSTKITDGGLENLKGLTQLKRLDLSCTAVTDAGLEHLRALLNLECLSLDSTQITDAGLDHLKGLSRVQGLYLSGTSVSDAGLVHLRGLTQLRSLSLYYCTIVKGSGLGQLKALTQIESLNLAATAVTDDVLVGLRELRTLTRLDLARTHVTDAALDNVPCLHDLESLDLSETSVGDAGLRRLDGLSSLRYLDLRGTAVTANGVQRLQRTLPNCEIRSKN